MSAHENKTKAGLFHTVVIMVRSALTILNTSIKAIFFTLLGKLTRERADAFIRSMSKNLLAHADVRMIAHVHEQAQKPPLNRPIIYMSNHSSLYDIPLIMQSCNGKVRMLSKKELFRIPIFGRAMRVSDFISVDRSNREQAMRDLAHAKKVLMSGVSLWAAPEGTRSRDGSLLPFKKGVFMLAINIDALIVPVGIRGANCVLQPKTWKFYRNNKVAVNVGKPIDAQTYDIGNRRDLMQRVYKEIASLAKL